MTTCSTASRELSEPLAGTAAVATTWLLVEQPGPWGAKALEESGLAREIGRELGRRCRGTGVRPALIRRPGRHPAGVPAGGRRVFLAHTTPGSSWVRGAVVGDPADLLGLDFAALGGGDHGGFGDPRGGDPLALVCTNARRDRCCALLGRPLIGELAVDRGADVWEITHLGGHRFAPTMLVLPYGYSYGRLEAATAKDVLEATAAGLMVPAWCRGRSRWDRPGQAAELAVRTRTGEDRAEALTVGGATCPGDPNDGTAGGRRRWTLRVVHVDGRAWSVEVAERVSEPPRPESCGKAPGTPARMDVLSVEPERPVPAAR